MGAVHPFSYLDDYDASHFRAMDDEEYLDPMELVKSQSTDGLRWAKSFINTAKKNNWTLEDINESLMLSWFTNAVATAKDSMR